MKVDGDLFIEAEKYLEKALQALDNSQPKANAALNYPKNFPFVKEVAQFCKIVADVRNDLDLTDKLIFNTKNELIKLGGATASTLIKSQADDYSYSFFDWAVKGISGLVDSVPEKAGEIWKSVKVLADGLLNGSTDTKVCSVADCVLNVLNGMSNGLEGVADTISDVFIKAFDTTLDDNIKKTFDETFKRVFAFMDTFFEVLPAVGKPDDEFNSTYDNTLKEKVKEYTKSDKTAGELFVGFDWSTKVKDLVDKIPLADGQTYGEYIKTNSVVEKPISDALNNFGRQIPTIVLSAYMGGANPSTLTNSLTTFVSVFSETYGVGLEEEIANGKNIGDARRSSGVDALFEAGIESISGGIGGTQSETVIKGIVGEVEEELIGKVLNPLKEIMKTKDITLQDVADILTKEYGDPYAYGKEIGDIIVTTAFDTVVTNAGTRGARTVTNVVNNISNKNNNTTNNQSNTQISSEVGDVKVSTIFDKAVTNSTKNNSTKTNEQVKNEQNSQRREAINEKLEKAKTAVKTFAKDTRGYVDPDGFKSSNKQTTKTTQVNNSTVNVDRSSVKTQDITNSNIIFSSKSTQDYNVDNMSVEDVAKEAQQQYNYDDNLTGFLTDFMNSTIDYYGENYSNKIKSVLLDVRVITGNNQSEILKQLEENYGITGYHLNSIASGAYEEYYRQNSDGVIERIPFIMILNNQHSNDTFVHELLHSVMNMNKQSMDNGVVHSKTGVIEDSITIENGKQVTKSINVALEEAFNEYDSRKIYEKIFGEKSNSKAYNMYVSYVSALMDNPLLRDAINSSRINGDNNWQQILGEELSSEFIASLENYEKSIHSTTISKTERESLYNKLAETYQKLLDFSKNYKGLVNPSITNKEVNIGNDSFVINPTERSDTRQNLDQARAGDNSGKTAFQSMIKNIKTKKIVKQIEHQLYENLNNYADEELISALDYIAEKMNQGKHSYSEIQDRIYAYNVTVQLIKSMDLRYKAIIDMINTDRIDVFYDTMASLDEEHRIKLFDESVRRLNNSENLYMAGRIISWLGPLIEDENVRIKALDSLDTSYRLKDFIVGLPINENTMDLLGLAIQKYMDNGGSIYQLIDNLVFSKNRNSITTVLDLILKSDNITDKIGSFSQAMEYIVDQPALINDDYIKAMSDNNVVVEMIKGGYLSSLSHIAANMNVPLNDIQTKILENYNSADESMKRHISEFVRLNYDGFIDGTIGLEKLDDIKIVFKTIFNSNSSELRRVAKEVAFELVKLDNPSEYLEKIDKLFLNDNVPYFVKSYEVFKLLHIKMDYYQNHSTMLNYLKYRSNHAHRLIDLTLFYDLMKCSIDSNNPDLKNYFNSLAKENKAFIRYYENNKNLSVLSSEESESLLYYLDKAEIALEGYSEWRGRNYNNDSSSLEERLKKLIYDYNITDNNYKTIPDLIARKMCGPLNINTLEEAILYMDNKARETEQRNIDFSKQGDLILKPGDLGKRITNINYLSTILKNGSVAKEFLGYAADSDSTPLDTDLSILTKEHLRSKLLRSSKISDIFDRTASRTVEGNIYFITKADNPNIVTTRTYDSQLNSKELSKIGLKQYELFIHSDYSGHAGIRTGYATSLVDAIVVNGDYSRVALEVALYGTYIPIYDDHGKLVFSYDYYTALRNKMSGLSYYGLDEYNISNNLVSEQILKTREIIDASIKDNQRNLSLIEKQLSKALETAGVKQVISGYSKDLHRGIAEIYSTGSTSRNTNVPGNSDFDYTIRIDNDIYDDPSKLSAFKDSIRDELGLLNGPGEKLVGIIKNINGEDLDVEISFVPRTDKLAFSTDSSLNQQLEAIKEQYPDKYKDVLANIVYAKQIMQENGVYKSAKSDSSQGGLGGIGIENWILQHGGSFIDAAKDFLNVAKNSKDFEDFASKYQVFDFGNNLYSDKIGVYPHDNFVREEAFAGTELKMTPDGYKKFVKVLEDFVSNYKAVEVVTPVVEQLVSNSSITNKEVNVGNDSFIINPTERSDTRQNLDQARAGDNIGSRLTMTESVKSFIDNYLADPEITIPEGIPLELASFIDDIKRDPHAEAPSNISGEIIDYINKITNSANKRHVMDIMLNKKYSTSHYLGELNQSLLQSSDPVSSSLLKENLKATIELAIANQEEIEISKEDLISARDKISPEFVSALLEYDNIPLRLLREKVSYKNFHNQSRFMTLLQVQYSNEFDKILLKLNDKEFAALMDFLPQYEYEKMLIPTFEKRSTHSQKEILELIELSKADYLDKKFGILSKEERLTSSLGLYDEVCKLTEELPQRFRDFYPNINDQSKYDKLSNADNYLMWGVDGWRQFTSFQDYSFGILGFYSTELDKQFIRLTDNISRVKSLILHETNHNMSSANFYGFHFSGFKIRKSFFGINECVTELLQITMNEDLDRTNRSAYQLGVDILWSLHDSGLLDIEKLKDHYYSYHDIRIFNDIFGFGESFKTFADSMDVFTAHATQEKCDQAYKKLVQLVEDYKLGILPIDYEIKGLSDPSFDLEYIKTIRDCVSARIQSGHGQAFDEKFHEDLGKLMTGEIDSIDYRKYSNFESNSVSNNESSDNIDSLYSNISIFDKDDDIIS